MAIMFINRTALFTIVIASLLIAIGGHTSSAFADTRKSTSHSYLSLPITVGGQNENRGDDGPPPAVLDKDRSSPLMSHTDDSSENDDSPPPVVLRKDESRNVDDSEWTTADNNTIPEKYMKSLSSCESSAAADGHISLAEIIDCFHRVF